MELRASRDTDMSTDLTPPLLPIAVSLHHPFILSHCSSCFHPIHNPRSTPPLSCCPASLRYCSANCLASDSDRHLSSGECNLLRQHQFHQQEEDSTGLRVSLRLLHSFEKAGLLPSSWDRLGRIAGLLARDCDGSGGEDCEVSRRVREGGGLMSRARGGGGSGEAEAAVLWAVLKNGVEVQIGEDGAIGVALYGPRFSWFNHSFSPNACYRFELAEGELPGSDGSGFLVYPAGAGKEEAAVLKDWADHERKLNQELCQSGPRIIIRSIKTIRKYEEICITDMDLMQPKALRHLDLWTKYPFVCRCSRCNASPETYVDCMLNESADCILDGENSSDNNNDDETWEEPADVLDQAITEFLSVGNPKACCEKVESILFEGFQDEQHQVKQSK